MQKISVSNGKYWAVVDDEDFSKVSMVKWFKDSGRNGNVYAKGNNPGYKKGNPLFKGWKSTIQMHRLILDLKKGNYVDHIDHDGLNNQKSNLRIVSNKQNCLNRNKQIGDYTSKFRGVCFNKNHKKWHAYININDQVEERQINLGYYDDEKTAALVYDGAMRKRYGDDYLNPNFPDFDGEYPTPNVRGKPKGYYFDPKRKLFCVEFRKNQKRFRGYAKTEPEAIELRTKFEKENQ
ncbi:MAG: Bacteriophage protein [Candidatus Woesebacteria bacterium GW2011_GWB1_39_12]|uniref:Bacteriophage protein n=1 Tax=Candidatus Woesebacteria bacterium GW2011_GWB1_39_12 TaxID=1618574 RepID=A0A0G0MFP7_9BACT|nr:MAG: Bacteriophage protein [Candidatus Woesebacteria bacterium GW2011_GWB1_39_12]